MIHVCKYCFHPVDEHHDECPYSETLVYPGGLTGSLATMDGTLVMITSEPDEDGQVGVMWLNPNRTVPLTTLERRPR